MDYGNSADELVYALTHGNPTPNFQDFEILESGYGGGDTAFAVLQTPDGRRFEVKVSQWADGE